MKIVTNTNYFGSGCWLLFPSLWSGLLIPIPIIFDQAIGYCFKYFGTGSLLLFPLFWMKLLSTFPIIMDQVLGYCSHHFGAGCWVLFLLFWISCWLLLSDPKKWEK
jgi:hypothetical protein